MELILSKVGACLLKVMRLL